MPKIRTHKATQKRFRITSTGKVMRRKAFKSHMLEHKSSKRKRVMNVQQQVSAANVKAVRRLAPYL